MNFKILPMTKNDLESIKDVLFIDFDDFWNYNTFCSELDNSNSEYIVCRFNDNIVGFAGILKVLDEVHITNIVVKKDLRKMGIGSILLEKLIEMAKLHNATLITLEVNCKNASAYQLYLKHNFKVVGFRKKYYNNTDDAIIMTLKFDKNKEETKDEKES